MKKALFVRLIMVFISVGCLVIMQSCDEGTSAPSQDQSGSNQTRLTARGGATTTVTDCDFLPWKIQGFGLVYTDPGPSTPPLGNGSLYFDAPDQTFRRLGDNEFVGQKLKDITELSYSTYIINSEQDADNVFLTIQIDTIGDGVADIPILFNPHYQSGIYVQEKEYDQGPISKYTWQNWDAVKGYWWIGSFTGTPIDPDNLGKLYTLKQMIEKFPNATIQKQATGTALSMRLAAGGPASGLNFKGAADNFHIKTKLGVKTYDFEDCPTPTP